MVSAGHWLGQLSAHLPAAARAYAARAHGSHEHLREGKWQYRVGVLSMGLFSRRGRPADAIARPNDRCGGETEQSLDYRAQPHFALASGVPAEPRESGDTTTGSRKTPGTVRRGNLSGAERQASEILLKALVNPQPAGEQEKHTGKNAADEQWARERGDFCNQLALLPGYVFFGRV